MNPFLFHLLLPLLSFERSRFPGEMHVIIQCDILLFVLYFSQKGGDYTKSIDFSNIDLSFSERITLRLIAITRFNIFLNPQIVAYLFSLGLLDRRGSYFFINRFGKMYFRIKRKEFLKFTIPTVISLVALFAGYDVYKIPLLGEALLATKTLLIHVMESLGIFG